MVFFNVASATAGVNIEVDIQSGVDDVEQFLVLSGAKASLPSPLPAHVSLGKPTVNVQSGHFELKLSTIGASDLPAPSAVELYDATALSKSMPTSFICSSCSLPLVQSTKVNEYKDLPSEHWQELVDVWMCHSDQKLHDEVMENAKHGFWPKEGEALVGGSYIVFEESGVVEAHIRHLEAREVSLITKLWGTPDAKKAIIGISPTRGLIQAEFFQPSGPSKPSLVLAGSEGLCELCRVDGRYNVPLVDTSHPRETSALLNNSWTTRLLFLELLASAHSHINLKSAYWRVWLGADGYFPLAGGVVQCKVHLWCDSGTHTETAFVWWGRCYVLPARQVCNQAREPGSGVCAPWRCANRSSIDTLVRPLRIPLSSFIVEDMMEYVQAHATYRFILHDDEEERPRILVRHC